MLRTRQECKQDRVPTKLILVGFSIAVAMACNLEARARCIPGKPFRTEFQLPGESLQNSTAADVDAYVQAADKAYAGQDFKNAALNYERAARVTNFVSMHTIKNPHPEELWFQKAVTSADRDKYFEQDELARLLVELGDCFGYESPPQAFPLYSRAVSLMSDSNPKKPEILLKLAGLCGQLKLPEEPGGDRVLRYQEQAALLAEKNGLPTAVWCHSRLAETEASIGLCDRAIAHCRHAMDLYEPKKSEQFSLRGEGSVVSLLADRGRADDAEKLLQEAVDRQKVTSDDKSPAVAAQLCELLRFYVLRHEDDKALRVLDDILSCDIRRFYGRFDDPVNLDPIYRWAFDATRSKQTQTASNILRKLLAAQESALAPDDLHTAKTLLQLGNVDYAAGDEKAALEDYQRGVDLLRGQFNERSALFQVPSTYLDLLRKNGQGSEAQRLQELRDSHNRPAHKI